MRVVTGVRDGKHGERGRGMKEGWSVSRSSNIAREDILQELRRISPRRESGLGIVRSPEKTSWPCGGNNGGFTDCIYLRVVLELNIMPSADAA